MFTGWNSSPAGGPGGSGSARISGVKFWLIAALLAVPVALVVRWQNEQPENDPDPVLTTATVTWVIDGDTVTVVDDERGELRVRLLGIDSPETTKKGYSLGCWGPEATAFAKDTLAGQRVALAGPSAHLRDRYNRVLAYLIKPDGSNYSVEAARAGVAKFDALFDDGSPEYRAIQDAEADAKAAKRGLWGPPCNGQTASVPIG